jgi:hypothetical protein
MTTNAHLTGEWRKPVNTAAHQKGGIHDDDTATDLGFRGGTVAGSIHMEQFPPLLEEIFGEDWWRTGTLSLYFKSATVDLEPVRCLVSEPEVSGSISRSTAWMEKEDGTVVLSGTASCGGHDPESELRKRLLNIRPIQELRILANTKVGDSAARVATRVPDDSIDSQLKVITEPLDCYKTPERFGRRVLPLTRIIEAYNPVEQIIAESAKPPFVGLYGAIEIEFMNGPVFSETDYLSLGQVVGLSDSPQTEILWRKLVLTEGDVEVARMIKMDRLMKNSSPLWDA